MAIPTLIYCGAGNKRFAQIAVNSGWKYGAQLPGTIYPEVASLYFADQDWKSPDRGKYMNALKEYRPTQATVLDLEYESQFSEVMSWAEEASQFVDRVIIIPKVFGIIPKIPQSINGKRTILGYSVPTKYAGTEVPIWEFGNRPVHLLGGSPHNQMKLRAYLNVFSADNNYINKMAARFCQFWMPGNAMYAQNRWFPTLKEANDGIDWHGDIDAPYEAFRRSCVNIIKAWPNGITGG